MNSVTYSPKLVLNNPSQLLLRNLHRLPATGLAGPLLVVNYPADGVLMQLYRQLPTTVLLAFTQDYAAHRQALTATVLDSRTLHFAPLLPMESEPCTSALIFLPKSRALLEMTLAMVAPALTPGAPVWLVGENGAGIRSSQALLTARIGPVRTVDNGRHCVLYQATLQNTPSPFQLDEWMTTYAVDHAGGTLTVVSLPGVFSHGRLDEGTRLLIETLEPPAGATVLDFACGTGVIGAVIKERWPEALVDLTDVNALALEATRRTLVSNRLTTRAIFPSDVFSAVTGRYDQILTNPPFHSGVAVDDRVVTTFLREASAHLTPGGALRVVANRFLNYPPLMSAQVGPCRTVAQNRHYAVYESRRV
jgi:16S rRNA (guanine1207-N2)-methyltransferase